MAKTLRSLSIVRQRGVTLTELMIALVLGALVVLAATAMVVTSRSTYRTQDESTRLAESARFGLELGNRLVRLAGYTNFGDNIGTPAAYTTDLPYVPLVRLSQPNSGWLASPDAYAFDGPNVVGANNSKPGGGSGLNGSDSLTIRFFGSSGDNAATPDGNVLDCAGSAVPEGPNIPGTTAAAANAARAMNVLFVDTDTDGEPALKCSRQTYNAAGVPSGALSDTQTLIRGVEDFQVLYGELIPPASPNDDLDNTPPASIVYRTGIGGPNPVGNWHNVRSVRIAMLLRSATGARSDVEASTATYPLFGSYPTTSSDTGTNFRLATLSATERTRLRRVVETTIFIRNRMGDWPSLPPP